MNGTASETSVTSKIMWDSLFSNNPRLQYGISDVDYRENVEHVFDTAELNAEEFFIRNRADIESLCYSVDGCRYETNVKIVDYVSKKNSNYRRDGNLSDLLKSTIKKGKTYTLMVNVKPINGGYYLRVLKGELNPYTQNVKAEQALYIRLIDGLQVVERLRLASGMMNHHSEVFQSTNDLMN